MVIVTAVPLGIRSLPSTSMTSSSFPSVSRAVSSTAFGTVFGSGSGVGATVTVTVAVSWPPRPSLVV
jgi:hypothetical protein